VAFEQVARNATLRPALYGLQVSAAIQAIKAQYPSVRAVNFPPQVIKQLSNMQTARERIVTDCMQGLQASMGSLRFQQLREFAIATEAPRIRQSGPSTTSSLKQ
jgi:hypothetical protein